MKNENLKEEEEIISIGNIQEEEKMLFSHDSNEENFNMSEMNQKTKSDSEPLYVMTLELEKGKNKQIKIYSNSNPAEVAFNFCKENNLDLSALTYLKEEIDKLIIQKPIYQDDDTQNQYEQSNALSRDSNRSSNLFQTSKLLHTNIQKNLEGDDISSIIKKNPSQISREESSLSESLLNNIISSSTKEINNEENNSINNNKNSFSFTTALQKKSDSTFAKISHTKKDNERQGDARDNNRHKNSMIKKHILTPTSNPFADISQSTSVNNKENTHMNNKSNANYITILNNRSKSKGQRKGIANYETFKPYCPSDNHRNKKYMNKHKDEIKQEIKKMFPFRPQINTDKQFQSQLTFLQRQEQFTSLVKKKTHNLSNLIYSNEDDPLFRPKLISKQRRDSNSHNHNSNSNNVFDKNFNYAMKYRKNKQRSSNQYYNDITKQANPIPESNKIVSQLYIDSFNKIFSKMDIDNDGVITSFNYTLKKLPIEIAQIIQPIINEMKSSNHQLTQDEFIFIMDYLCSNNELSLKNKKAILDYNKKAKRNCPTDQSSNGNCRRFDVHINSKSRKLAVKHQKKMLRSLSSKHIISDRPSSQITKEKYFINQSTANTERKMSSKKNIIIVNVDIRHYTFDHFKQSVLV